MVSRSYSNFILYLMNKKYYLKNVVISKHDLI